MVPPDQPQGNNQPDAADAAAAAGNQPPAQPVAPDAVAGENQPPVQPVADAAIAGDQPPIQPAVADAAAAGNQPPAQVVIPDPAAAANQPPAAGGIAQVQVPAGSAGGVDVKGDIQKLGALPRVGYRLALMVLTLIGVVTILVVIQWWRSAPWTGVPAGFSSLKSDDAKAVAENLKILSDMSIDRSLKLFDDIVGRVLLPVFTSILGYIFGTRGGDTSNTGASK